MIIKNGNVLLYEEGGFVQRDICVEDKKIVAVAAMLQPKDGEEIVDATGLYVTPGLIDAHSHICICEESVGEMGDDCCDYSGTFTPGVEVMDGLYPFDRAVPDCVRAGVTTTCVAPGSDGVVGGIASVISLTGHTAEEMMVLRKAAMKCSVGENPKCAKYNFSSRMGVAYQLRKAFEDTLEYRYSKEEALAHGNHFQKDIGFENMLLVMDKKIPIHMHAHRSDDICTAIRIAQEYDIDMVLIHCTDGIAVADVLGKYRYPAVLGPSMNSRSKLETFNKTFATAGVLAEKGVKVSICSDHDVTPMYYLPVYAGMAVRYGLDELEALKSITKNAAETLHIHDRKGEIKVGLDADIVLWNGHPFHYTTKAECVYIEGKAQF